MDTGKPGWVNVIDTTTDYWIAIVAAIPILTIEYLILGMWGIAAVATGVTLIVAHHLLSRARRT